MALATMPPHCPSALFIRHAERYDVTDFATHAGVQLTPAGEDAAFALGQQLPEGRAVHVLHSPIQRCQVTAARIAEGYNAMGGAAQLEGALEELCGHFIRDYDAVTLLTRQYKTGPGSADFVRAWFDGELPATAIECRDSAVAYCQHLFEGYLCDADAESLFIFVSHDWDIMVMREGWLGLRHEDVGWLGFLDGVAMAWNGTQLQMGWGIG